MPIRCKVCGVTSQEDARLALDLGADYIGLIIYPKSPRALTPAQAKELLDFIPEGQGVLVDVATATDVLERYRPLPFAAMQIHFDLDVAISTVAAWSGQVGEHRLWLAPRVPTDEPYFPQIIMEFAHTFVADAFDPQGAYGGTGRTGDWQRFVDWTLLYQHKQWILAGGLNPDNLPRALLETGADFVDVNSGVEATPGRKDPAKLRRFFDALREADHLRRSTTGEPDADHDR